MLFSLEKLPKFINNNNNNHLPILIILIKIQTINMKKMMKFKIKKEIILNKINIITIVIIK